MPVKNYSPELLKVFEAGSKKPFEFVCASEKSAIALRWRLHALRREMRKEKHWLLPVAESVIVTAKGNLLIVRPPDMDIAEELKKALIEQAPEVMEMPKEISKQVSPDALETYLKRRQ